MKIIGTLPSQQIIELVKSDFIIDADMSNVSPASLDLTISDEIYKIEGLLLPREDEKIRDILPYMSAERHSIKKPLNCGELYIAKLHEKLQLPSLVYGYCNPKSSTGRLDMHVRVLADGVPRYDSVTPMGYSGDLWLAMHPKSFSILLHEGSPLTQLRLFTGDTRFNNLDLEIALRDGIAFEPGTNKKLLYGDLVTNEQDGSLVLTALVEEGNCGYVCTAKPDQVIDVNKINHYNPEDFFSPVEVLDGFLHLRRDKFYILSGYESIRIPPSLASEMVPVDERSGDFRSHYAGFLDPGWGWGDSGEIFGRPFTLEVRPFEDMVIRPRQPIAKIRFERMSEEPLLNYDQKSSNYKKQTGPKLAKYFR